MALVFATGCYPRPGSGHGRVLDALSRQPVPGATVKVTCATYEFFHRSYTETRTAMSRAPDGAFFVDPVDFRRCGDIWANAAKPGYAPNNTSLSNVSEELNRIPEIVYLIDDRDVPMLTLRSIEREIPLYEFQAGPDALRHFTGTYVSFMKSREIAGTPELDAWVRAHYCERLRATDALLSDAERASLDPRHTVGYPGADSYQKDVLPYCSR